MMEQEIGKIEKHLEHSRRGDAGDAKFFNVFQRPRRAHSERLLPVESDEPYGVDFFGMLQALSHS